MIERLRGLRRRREGLAKEKMLHRQAESARAARHAREAADAVEAHRQSSALQESTALGALVGQQVDLASLYRMQGNFDIARAQAEQLRQDEARALEATDERKAAFASARNVHHQRLKAVMKLDELASELNRRGASRRAAIEELSDDDNQVPRSGAR